MTTLARSQTFAVLYIANPEDARQVLDVFDCLKSVQLEEVHNEAFMDRALQGPCPDLILVDELALGGKGLRVLERVLCAWPGSRTLFLAGDDNGRAAIGAMRAGASDLLLKQPEELERLPETLLEAVQAARRPSSRLAASPTRWRGRPAAGGTTGSTANRSAACVSRLKEEQLYRSLAETACDLILIHDFQGRVTYANSHCGRLLGCSPNSLLGRQFKDLVLADEHPQLEALRRKRINGHRGVERYETTLVGVSGLPIPLEVSSTVVSATGSDAGVLLIGRDMRPRRQDRRRILDQAAILDEVEDAIFVTDLEGCILDWNEGSTRLLGWEQEQATGRHAAEFLFCHSDANLAEAFRGMNGKGRWRGDLRLMTSSGEEAPVKSRWKLLCDEQGQPNRHLVVNTDVSKWRELEAQFLRSQRMESVGALTAGVSHDLNNVLEPILLSAGLLRIKAGDESLERHIAAIENSAQRASRLVKQLVGFTRGGCDGEQHFDLRHLISETVQVLKQTLPVDISVEARVEKRLPRIKGDATQIHQVLLNLCVNARDAMSDGGILRIEALRLKDSICSPDGDAVRLVVSDSGEGMESKVRKQIFEPFFTTKPDGKGTGLGLSTVRAIVDSHAGKIAVFSKKGSGTRFEIELPAVDRLSEAPPDAAAPQVSRGAGETVLLIDDDDDVLATARDTLRAFGYKVLTAHGGGHAVSTLVQHSGTISVAVCDIMMPLMDGPRTIRALRERQPGMQVIAVSGGAEAEKLREAEESGAGKILIKPYTGVELVSSIQEVLQQGSSLAAGLVEACVGGEARQ